MVVKEIVKFKNKNIESIMPLLNGVIDSLPFERKIKNSDGTITTIQIDEITLKDMCNHARIKMSDLSVDYWEQSRTLLFENILEVVLENSQVTIIDIDIEEQDFKIKKI